MTTTLLRTCPRNEKSEAGVRSARSLSTLSWSTEFEDPIPGMITLRDAADQILQLPKATQQLPHWHAALEALIMAAEGHGPLLHARVGMLRAVNHGRGPV